MNNGHHEDRQLAAGESWEAACKKGGYRPIILLGAKHTEQGNDVDAAIFFSVDTPLQLIVDVLKFAVGQLERLNHGS